MAASAGAKTPREATGRAVRLYVATAWSLEASAWNRGFKGALVDHADLGDGCVMTTPAEADLILFADTGSLPFQLSLLAHPLFRKYARKCFVFDANDNTVPLLPGCYASLDSSMARLGWACGGFLAHRDRDGVFDPLPMESPRWLFSFCGTCSNAPVREALAAHDYKGQGKVVDTSGQVETAFNSHNDDRIRALRESFCETTRESSFALCPRGIGQGSWRIHEVMEMARAPVIIGDGWLPIPGPDWNAFSIRVREADVAKLPMILSEHAGRAREMGLAARRVWEEFFSPATRLQTVVDACLTLRKTGLPARRWRTVLEGRHLLVPWRLKCVLRSILYQQ